MPCITSALITRQLGEQIQLRDGLGSGKISCWPGWITLAEAAKEVLELISAGWGSALPLQGQLGLTASLGSAPKFVSRLTLWSSTAGRHTLSLQPSELMSNLKYCIRWETKLWENDMRWIQNYFRTLKEGYVNWKREKIRLNRTICTSLEQHCAWTADLSLQVNKWSLSNASENAWDFSVRGQPKAGLRTAKWNRVIKWKFRGTSNRASHLLGLTDLWWKGRRAKKEIL